MLISPEVESTRELAHHRRAVMMVAHEMRNLIAPLSSRGGSIDLFIEREALSLKVRVCDTGIGLAGDELSRVFEAGARVNQSLDKTPGGFGVGLTVARHLVELHGGTLHAQSAGPGKGSEFVMLLPEARIG